jgi:hypothetical protein
MLAVVLVGCGDQPTRPTTPETASNPAPAAGASSQAVPAPSTQSTATAAGQSATGAAAEQAPAKVPAGFRTKKINGQIYYCRSESTIGSKFKQELCYTQDQLDEIERRADEVMDVVGRGCVGAACGSND